jgi:hypothetical protein
MSCLLCTLTNVARSDTLALSFGLFIPTGRKVRDEISNQNFQAQKNNCTGGRCSHCNNGSHEFHFKRTENVR